MTLTEDDVRKLLKLEAEVTPDRWVVRLNGELEHFIVHRKHGEFAQDSQRIHDGRMKRLADAQFIAASRNAIKELCEDWLSNRSTLEEMRYWARAHQEFCLMPDRAPTEIANDAMSTLLRIFRLLGAEEMVREEDC